MADMRFRAAIEADRRDAPISAESGAWLVVITKAGKEQSVHDRLVAQGFEVCLLLQPVCDHSAKRRGVSVVPFFPRMLFARATMDVYRWHAIFYTYGVQRVMSDPAKPRGVTHAFIERMRARMFDEFLAIGLVDPSKPPQPKREKDRRKWMNLGDVVEGLSGLVAHERESVLVSLLNEGHRAVAQMIPRK